MADLESSSSLVDSPRSRRRNYWTRVRTILHAAVVTILFIVIIFSCLYIHRKLNLCGERADDRTYALVFLIILLVTYTALGFLYIFNSSGVMEKIISAGFLAFVLSVFLLCSISIDPVFRFRVEFLAGANIAAIFAYCVWMLHPAVRACLCTLRKEVRTILHVAILTILLLAITLAIFYFYTRFSCDNVDYGNNNPVIVLQVQLTIQLIAYTAVGCLYMFNSFNQMQKGISAGFLVLVLSICLLSSIGNERGLHSAIYEANMVAISSYSIWKLYLAVRGWPWLPWLCAARDALLERSGPEAETTALLQLGIQAELLREFSSHEIRAMTQDFASMVDQGGFAQVFRGTLDDGTAVAVKRMVITTSCEVVTGDDDFLREVSKESRLLTWPTRRCIAVDVARALAYLHHECHRRILHLDVKPGNILLDGGPSGVVDTRGRGTFGYMAPEMLVNAVSDKSDVYSYGMTLLELVGGRRNFEEAASTTPDLAREFFPCVVREKMARGELMEAVDAAIMADVDEEAAELVVRVALCCIQRRRDLRPSMLAVVDMLEGRVDADLPLPPESRPSSAVDFQQPLFPLHSRTAGDDIYGPGVSPSLHSRLCSFPNALLCTSSLCAVRNTDFLFQKLA
ncbi:unnamed protein product [Urochloa decumbens]|uniref:Protein kinase domain-containing protein n=1 Tax=Urochloa decumbens TaxID=240449 RepID=A0ABC8VI06_9POAL